MSSSKTIGFILGELVQTCVFWGLGGACFGVTLKALLQHDYAFFVTDALDSDKVFSSSAYLLVVGGALLILLGFFGPVVVCINKSKAFYVLAVFQVLVGVLILIGGILSGITRIEFRDGQMHEQGEEMTTLLEKYYGNTDFSRMDDPSWGRRFTKNWNLLQQKQRCCGPRDSSWQAFRRTDWYDSLPGTPEVDRPYVPESCCFHDRWRHVYNLNKCQMYEDGPPRLLNGENEAVYGRGCNHAIRDFLYEHTRYFMGLGICTGLVAILSALLPVCLGIHLARDQKAGDTDQLDNSMGQNSFGTTNTSYVGPGNYGYYQGRPQRYANSKA